PEMENVFLGPTWSRCRLIYIESKRTTVITAMVEDPMLEHDKVEDTKTISDSCILKLSNDTEKWTMKKNLYSCLGILFQFNYDTAQEWSYLDKNEKKCLMLLARVSCLRIEGCVWQQAFRSDKRLAASGVAKHTLRVLCIARVLEGIVVSVLINLIQFCSTKIPIKTIPFASKIKIKRVLESLYRLKWMRLEPSTWMRKGRREEEIATLLALWKWGSESIRIWWQGVPCSSKPPEK
ncbi:hypothetical protein Tco_0835197, partial [Tanacetum coccineum]